MKFRKKSKAIIAVTTFSVVVCVCLFAAGVYTAPSIADDMKTREDKELVIEAAGDIQGNLELDNKDSSFSMELDKYYDDADPFVNRPLAK